MASGRLSFFSTALSGLTNVTFAIPTDMPESMGEINEYYRRPTKTLYLLHGFSGNDEDWLKSGPANDLSFNYNLAIFMVDAGNNFYLDREATGCQFQTFTGEEVVEFTRKTFGLSSRQEDTFIGGFSMGGFGAMHTAFTYPDTFGGAICLSSALIVHEITDKKPGYSNNMANYAYYREVFGDLEGLDQTTANPEVLYLQQRAAGKSLPPVYMAIGTNDPLYENNQVTRHFLEEQRATVQYEEAPGDHNWAFWNQYINKGIEWILDQTGSM